MGSGKSKDCRSRKLLVSNYDCRSEGLDMIDLRRDAGPTVTTHLQQGKTTAGHESHSHAGPNGADVIQGSVERRTKSKRIIRWGASSTRVLSNVGLKAAQ